MPKRERPLQAPHGGDGFSGAAAAAEAEMAELAHDVVVTGPASHDPEAESKRVRRLADGVRQLRVGGGTLKLNERVLLVLGGIIAPLGLVVVLIGWMGASRTPNLYEQIPYAISGGLFGLGLVFVGSFLYFAHWITELVKEHRAQSAAVVDAIGRLEELMRTAQSTPGSPAAMADGTLLVATDKGTMAHRPDCVIVAGKPGLRSVSPNDGLAPCKLCDPYALAVN